MIRRRAIDRGQRRGVAQLEFVANFPLIVALLGLVILVGCLLGFRSQAEAALGISIPVRGQDTLEARGRDPYVDDGTGLPSVSFEVRQPLQVPARFGASGDEGMTRRLWPIARLAQPSSLGSEVRP
jgi:hypothetical protein